MSQPVFKAPDQDNAVATKKLYRDTRTSYRQFMDLFKSPVALAGVILFGAIYPFIDPAAAFFTPPFFSLVYWLRMRKASKEHLDFRMPITAKRLDYGEPKPGRRGYEDASGVFFLGRTLGASTTELWIGIRDMLTHMLIFGTTGSGKTEALVSLAFNSLAIGSGMFYVDPKGSPKLIAQIYVLCRMVGRDSDFRCINYLTAEKAEAGGKMPRRTTNMINPFAYGNAESLSNMMNSLIPKSEGGNQIFSANARNLLKSTMYPLVELRDRGEIQLSAKTITEYLTLSKVLALAERNDLTKNTTETLRAFLTSVGWQEGKDERSQPKSLPEQFGYARSYFGEPLGNLTATYGHIYNTPFGEIDMRDVVMNRRTLVIVIPSLSMASEEVKSLGVIALSSIRIAISVGLGTGKEGTFADTLYSLPTDAPAPFLSITDEYAAIPVPGYVEVLTQGRGLYIAAIVASQDYAGITKADKEGAAQLLENTKVKLFMKLTSAGETFDVAKGLAGEINIMESQGYQVKTESSSMSSDYRDNMSASVKERAKITLADLQQQGMGEFHSFFNEIMVRGSVFFANPPLPHDGQIQYNHLVSIYPPTRREIELMFGETPEVTDQLLTLYSQLEPISTEISVESRIALMEQKAIEQHKAETGRNPGDQLFVKTLRKVFDKPLLTPMDTAIAAFVKFCAIGGEPVENPEFDDFINEGNEEGDDFDLPPESRGEQNPFSTDDDIDYFASMNNDAPDHPDEPTQQVKSPVRHDEFMFPDATDDLIDHAAIVDETDMINEIAALSQRARQESLAKAAQSNTLDNDLVAIEKAIDPVVSEEEIKARALRSSRAIKSAGDTIMENYPKQPAPKNNPYKKNHLSNQLSNMISSAINKKSD